VIRARETRERAEGHALRGGNMMGEAEQGIVATLANLVLVSYKEGEVDNATAWRNNGRRFSGGAWDSHGPRTGLPLVFQQLDCNCY